jgi:hypothetical protein
MRFGQEDVLAEYVEKYLEAADTIWDRLGTHMASNALESAFPLPMGSPDLVARVDRWLDESPANPAAKRYVQEGRADVVRALAAQQKDAASRRPGTSSPRTTPTRHKFTPYDADPSPDDVRARQLLPGQCDGRVIFCRVSACRGQLLPGQRVWGSTSAGSASWRGGCGGRAPASPAC